MWERLQRFSRLDAEARGIFLRAAVLLPLISVNLKMRGFRATQELLLRFLLPVPPAPADDSSRFRRDGERTVLIARMVDASVRHAWHTSTCLEKSLALWWLLRRQGIPSEVRIGARKLGGKFEAHAWVESDGVAVNEPQQAHRHYATFDVAFPLQSPEIS